MCYLRVPSALSNSTISVWSFVCNATSIAALRPRAPHVWRNAETAFAERFHRYLKNENNQQTSMLKYNLHRLGLSDNTRETFFAFYRCCHMFETRVGRTRRLKWNHLIVVVETNNSFSIINNWGELNSCFNNNNIACVFLPSIHRLLLNPYNHPLPGTHV